MYLFLRKEYMTNLNPESRYFTASNQIQAIEKINIVKGRVIFLSPFLYSRLHLYFSILNTYHLLLWLRKKTWTMFTTPCAPPGHLVSRGLTTHPAPCPRGGRRQRAGAASGRGLARAAGAAPSRPPRVAAAAAAAEAEAWGIPWRSRGGILRLGRAAVQVLVSWSSILALGSKQSSWGPAPCSSALLLPFRLFFTSSPPSSPSPSPSQLLIDFS